MGTGQDTEGIIARGRRAGTRGRLGSGGMLGGRGGLSRRLHLGAGRGGRGGRGLLGGGGRLALYVLGNDDGTAIESQRMRRAAIYQGLRGHIRGGGRGRRTCGI